METSRAHRPGSHRGAAAWTLLCSMILVAAGMRTAHADASETAKADAPIAVAADSPRASLVRYLDLARSGKFSKAADYLQVPEELRARRVDLAERLKVVLDRNIWFNMETISPKAEGNLSDGLAPDKEDVAGIPGPGGVVDPVRFVRVVENEGARWLFSAATVRHIDVWYGRLGDHWIRDHLPEVLLRPGPHELLWWQWVALPVLLVLSWLLGTAFGWLARKGLGLVFHRTATRWDDVLLARMAGPLTLVCSMVVAFALLPFLSLYEPAEVFIERLLRAVLFVAFFWALLRTVDVAADFLTNSSWGITHKAVGAFIPLGVRIGKVVVVAMAAIAILSELGYPVASLIAGLGIGGLALALAAQKTVENLFGSVSLGVDQPIRVGDFVKVEDFMGTVESIGLRSTRIRTLERTVVSIPNGKLADMRLETFAPRDRVRFASTVGLVYDTTEAQMRNVVARFEKVLRSHPKVWQEAIRVCFIQFGASSLDVEISCWFETADFNEFSYMRQDVLLAFMKIVEEEGTSFAFPTRTVQMLPPHGMPSPQTPAAAP